MYYIHYKVPSTKLTILHYIIYMRLHVSTTTWSSSGPLKIQKPELRLQRQLWGHTEVSMFRVTKCMPIKLLKAKQSVLLFVVFVKEAFYKDNQQQRWQILLLNAIHILFVFKNFPDMRFVSPNTETSIWPHNWRYNCNSGFVCSERLEDHAVAETCSHISIQYNKISCAYDNQ